jgi:hypothetical protein
MKLEADRIIQNILHSVCVICSLHHVILYVGRLRLKCGGTRAETRFRLSTKRTSSFKSAGASVQSKLAAELCASAVVMLDTPCCEVVSKVLATHFILQLTPSLPLLCVTVCHHISTGLYQIALTGSYSRV